MTLRRVKAKSRKTGDWVAGYYLSRDCLIVPEEVDKETVRFEGGNEDADEQR